MRVGVPAEPGVRLVERDPGLPAEHVRGRQPGDPAADDGDLARRTARSCRRRARTVRSAAVVGCLRAGLGLDGDPDPGRLRGVALQQQLVVARRSSSGPRGCIVPGRRPAARPRRPCRRGGAAMSRVTSTALPSLDRADHGRAGAVVELDRVRAWRRRRRAPGRRHSALDGVSSCHGWNTAPPTTATTAAAAATRAAIRRRRRRSRQHLGVAGVASSSRRRLRRPVSGGSGRIVLMPASTEPRSDGGGVSAASSAIRAVASRRLATSRWQSRHPGRCCSKSCPLVVVECVDDVGTGQRVH